MHETAHQTELWKRRMPCWPTCQAKLGVDAETPVVPLSSRAVSDISAALAVPPSWPFSPLDTELPHKTQGGGSSGGDDTELVSVRQYHKHDHESAVSTLTSKLVPRVERLLAQAYIRSSNMCRWKRPNTIFTRDHYSSGSCSYDFCSSVDPMDMRRCIDPDEYDRSGHLEHKTADDVDWKEGASPDCMMCYPVIDCAAIDAHCQRIERAEASAFIVLSSLLIASLVFSLCAICYRWYRERHSQQLHHRVFPDARAPVSQMNHFAWSMSPAKACAKQYDGTGIEITRSSELQEPDLRAWKDRMLFVQKTAQQAGMEVERDLENQRAEREEFEKEREDRRGRSMPW